jgi:hypothetical protein
MKELTSYMTISFVIRDYVMKHLFYYRGCVKLLKNVWWKITEPLSNYLNKKHGTICFRCKYCNGISCTAGFDWYQKCCGLTNKGFTAR